MKKSARVLSIIALVLTIAAGVLFVFTPKILGSASYNTLSIRQLLSNLLHANIALFTNFTTLGWRMVLPIGLLAVVLVFIIHIIIQACKKRQHVWITIVWLIVGLVVGEFAVMAAYPGFFGSNTVLHAILAKKASGATMFQTIIALIPWGLIALAGLLLIIMVIISVAFVCTHGKSKKKYVALTNDENSPLLAPVDEASDAEIKEVLDDAYGVPNRTKVTSQGYVGGAPTIVQYISFDGVRRGEEKKEAPAEPALTKEELIAIIAEELDKRTPVVEEKEEPVAEEPLEEEQPVLTAKELREIVRQELTGTGPKEEPIDDDSTIITSADLRRIIRAEIAANAPKEEVAPAPVVEEPVEEVEEEEEKPLTAEDLRALIQEALHEHDNPENHELTEEEARDLIVEEIKTYYLGKQEEVVTEEEEIVPPTLSAEDVRTIIKEEIANAPKEEPQKVLEPSEVKSIVAEEVEKLRQEQKEAAEKAKQEALDAAKVEEARAEAEAEQVRAQSEEIKSIKESLISNEDIRSIIADELAKALASLQPVVVETPVVEEPVAEEAAPEVIVVEEPVAEEVVEETPVVETPVTEEAPAKPAIVRIPFPTRMLEADEETKQNYNELKAEALAFGLKSRLSNSGDTFRLHTKTYVKITIAGKGLKLYLALDPLEYENTSIPVKNAGTKNIYKDIPTVFKVKSPLSLRRAKQLIADAAEKDNLEQGKVELKDWVSPLRDYRPQLGGKPEDEDEDEE